jgi:dolichyl-phosphate beta-glucosyltransferase
MSRWQNKRLIGLALLIAIVHSTLLFLVLPKVGARLAPAYNQDRYSDGYDELAANLVAGNGYRFYPDTARTLMREPGYPVLLAGLLLTFGNSFTVVKLTNVILALLTAWLMMRIAKKLAPDALSGNNLLTLAAPLLFLFHPGTLIAESRGGVEILFAFLITLFMLVLTNAIESNRWWLYLAGGIVLGITVSVRSTPMLFPFLLLVYLLVFERRRLSVLSICRNVTLMIVAMLAVLSPWIVRNYALTGKFVPTASVLGVSAHAGQYIGKHQFEGKPWWLLDREAARERDRLAAQLGYPFEDGDEGYYQTFYKSENEIKFSQYLFGKVIGEYQKSPALFLRLVGQNIFNFWFAGKTWAATAANVGLQLPYLVVAFFGALFSLKMKQAKIAGVMVLFMAYIMAVHLPILAQARYSMPLIPLISILASIALVTARRRMTEREIVATMKLGTFGVGSSPGSGSATPSLVIEETRQNLGHLREQVELKPVPRCDIYLSIVIPAYNEQARLPRTVLETIQWCTTKKLDFELIIADDGSRDETLALARLFEDSDSRIRVISCPHMGKGSAVRLGVLNAKGRYVLFMDADGATPQTEIPKLLDSLEEGFDVAIGSRVIQRPGEVDVKTSFYRRFIGRVFAFFVGRFAIEGINDTQCGFKMFRREAALEIFSRQKIAGFAFDVEILFIARRLSLTVAEIPVNWVAQPGSKVNLVTDSIKMFADICIIRWLHRSFRASTSMGHARHPNQSLEAESQIG